MPDDLLLLDGVGLTVGSRSILQDINLAVRKGEIHALVGANGSGKSSLALLVMGCGGYAPSRGALLWEGQSIVDEPMHERARRVSRWHGRNPRGLRASVWTITCRWAMAKSIPSARSGTSD